ncbi:MAG: hypothetical protein AMR96_00295 [Candidatus Adiutrix intracellularis]|jgi:DnaJ-class molecular chaperone|nr:MAG: hypothetical protein AMR96_00295 [Candidatus Adiutrix intracellularis]MDR2826946.1 DnaJ domain-containing protein [Candidatus Adiutrix intracellularis]
MSLDPYKVLGVDKNADMATVKAAYRKLARQYHPDMNPGDPVAENKFKKISEAYDILSDPTKKQEYDNLGREAFYERGFGGTGYQRPDFNKGGFSFEEIFSELFGSRHSGDGSGCRSSHAEPRKGEDVNTKLAISLKEAALGTETTLKVEFFETCLACRGRGLAVGSGGQPRSCPSCGGQGRLKHLQSLKTKIPAGLKDGQIIRLRGQGASNPTGGGRGDLLVEVLVKPDLIFTRQGKDLSTELSVSLYQALLGGMVEVPTLTGRATLKLPSGGTQNGTRMRLKGQGLPATPKEAAGDLYVTLKVLLPTKLSSEAKKIVASLAKVAPLLEEEK